MASLLTSLTLYTLLSVIDASSVHHIRRGSKSALQWGPCNLPLNTTLPVACAKLPVPLDYTDQSSNKTLVLDLIKYSAKNGTANSSVILNFGGPGEDGLISMLDYAPLMENLTGRVYDLISFDPRGTGNTLPFRCFPGETNPAARKANAYLNETLWSSSDTSPGRLWAASKIVADACYDRLKEYGDLVGMAFTARDMMQIVDALKEDGMLRYYGISGGTILGATAAAMFPDRMDKIVIDGVVNAHQYYHELGIPEMFAATDATWQGFLAGCLASPGNCDLAKRASSVSELNSILEELFKTVKYNPIPYNGTIIDVAYLKWNIGMNLYVPTFYPKLATALDDLLSGNLPKFKAAIERNDIPDTFQAQQGIMCGDKIPRTENITEVQPIINRYYETSEAFGDLSLTYYVLLCARWPFKARERYEGDFRVKTKNPMLIIGNTYDPITPWISAKNMSESFEGSVALQHDGFGHLSFSQPSSCTVLAIIDYFVNGTLPQPGTKCEPAMPIFKTLAG